MLPYADTGINPVARVMPVLPIRAIGDVAQELDFRALQFVRGQEYFAKVVSRVDATSYNVKVDNTLLRMELGSQAQVGQSLLLKYLADSPVPTFQLALDHPAQSGSTTSLSNAGQLLGRYLQQAQQDGTPSRLEASGVVSRHPENPPLLAQDLKQAISNSGLFYESHLKEVVQGQRAMASMQMEPQNQNNAQLASMVSQQLAVLEQQRLSWQGQVWPGQDMQWDIYRQPDTAEQGTHSASAEPAGERPIISELTLHLPKLGKVSARLTLVDGHMRIALSAEQTDTTQSLKQQSFSLVQSLQQTGQQLDGISVVQGE